jgi:DNA-binding MarR family transcriptional regulator
VSSGIGSEVVRFMRGFKSVHMQTSHRARHGVDPSAYPVLFQLIEAPQRTTELATSLHADTSTVSRQVAGLVDLGLVERTADPEDRRAMILVPTQAGRALFEEMQQDRDRMLARIVTDWPPGEVETLVKLLGRFNDDFDEARPAIIADFLKEH